MATVSTVNVVPAMPKAPPVNRKYSSTRRDSRAFAVEGEEPVFADPGALARKGDRPVSFSLTVYQVSSLDPVHGRFFADVGLHMMWFEPALIGSGLYANPDGDGDGDGDAGDQNSHMPMLTELTGNYLDLVHVPNMYMDNSLSLEDVNRPFVNVRRCDPRGVVRWEQRRRGTFSEIFELEAFPFDVQTPVNFLQNTFSDRTHYIAQLRPGSSFLLSALRFLDRVLRAADDL